MYYCYSAKPIVFLQKHQLYLNQFNLPHIYLYSAELGPQNSQGLNFFLLTFGSVTEVVSVLWECRRKTDK